LIRRNFVAGHCGKVPQIRSAHASDKNKYVPARPRDFKHTVARP
jgi:hypothetical protein